MGADISNPNKPGIPFLVFLGITALANMGFRTYYFCDKMQDILVGVILGGLIGFLIFNEFVSLEFIA